MAQFVKLPDERHAQLKALASARGVTMVGLIGEWINQEISAGRLPDAIPGFSVGTIKARAHRALARLRDILRFVHD